MPPQLNLSTTVRDSAAVVSVGGEVDMGTANQLGEHLAAALQDSSHHDVVLDMSEVSFMDSTGLKVLLATHRRAQLLGGQLALVAPGRSVSRVLTVTGLDRTFVVADTVEEAIQAVGNVGGAADRTAEPAADAPG